MIPMAWRRLRRKGQLDVEFRIVWEGFGVRLVRVRAVARHGVRALLAALQRLRDVVPVAHDEIGRIDEKPPAFVRENLAVGTPSGARRARDYTAPDPLASFAVRSGSPSLRAAT